MIQMDSILLISNFLSKHVHTRGIGEELQDQLVEQGWNVLITSHRMNKFFRLIDMLWTIWARRTKYQIAQIDVYSGPAFWWAFLAGRLLYALRKPFVVTLHGGNLPPFSLRHPKQVTWLLHTADAVTTPSTYLQSSLIGVHKDIILLRNGINLTRYRFTARTSPQPDIAWLRAFHEVYNPVLAVKTLALLRDEFPVARLTMYGPDKRDSSFEQVQQLAKDSRLDSQLSTPGSIPKIDVPNKLRRHDIFINTTNAESFGVSVVEAGALGMCIVTTNVGELPHLWTHNHDALLVPPNDPTAMAAAIRRILTEPGLAEHLSRNARATAEQFDWSVILPQWEALFKVVGDKQKLL